MQTTRGSLLDRLAGSDPALAWEEFYRLYWGVILRYATRLGLDESLAQDVLQETMLALMRALPRFRYDRAKGRFRNFLLTITHRKAMAMLRRRGRKRETPLEEDAADPATPAGGPADSEDALPDRSDEERWQASVLDEAWAGMCRDGSIQPQTLAVFRDYVVEGMDAGAVAAKYGLKENAVYQIKNRLTRRLRDDASRLLAGAT